MEAGTTAILRDLISNVISVGAFIISCFAYRHSYRIAKDDREAESITRLNTLLDRIRVSIAVLGEAEKVLEEARRRNCNAGPQRVQHYDKTIAEIQRAAKVLGERGHELQSVSTPFRVADIEKVNGEVSNFLYVNKALLENVLSHTGSKL